MTTKERDLLRRALDLLHRLSAEEPYATDPVRRNCPVINFAETYLARDPASDATSEELWVFFSEVVASGEVEQLSRAEFLNRLPGVMELKFGVHKSHNLMRDGGRQRGFKGVGIRMNTGSTAVLESEPE